MRKPLSGHNLAGLRMLCSYIFRCHFVHRHLRNQPQPLYNKVFNMQRLSWHHVILLFLVVCVAHCAGPGVARHPQRVPRIVQEEANPWTHLELNNDPAMFRFAVVSDRTGNHRPGVFEAAMDKLNLLQPEFVVSVGDLIEGYTDDQRAIDTEWAEFARIVASLEMPFFFVPGNHDISNPTMLKDWQQRYGRTYYHFIYRDVLFLCLNSEDVPEPGIGADQRQYIERALAKHPDVRWTFVFMHQPLWLYEGWETGWETVETMLLDRPHTVFAGHYHSYARHQRNEHLYYVLATTGGGSGLRGRAFGEFDHVVWVTMTEAGPRLANLMLDGIQSGDWRTAEMAQLVHAFYAGGVITAEPILAADGVFSSATTSLRFNNSVDVPITITGTLSPHPQLVVEPAAISLTLPPQSEELVEARVQARQPETRMDDLMTSDFEWQAVIDPGTVEPLELAGTSQVAVERHFDCARGPSIRVDGDLSDWHELPIVCDQPVQIAGVPDSWTGPDDLSFRFGVHYDDEYLYIGIEVTDDRTVLRPGFAPWQQDGNEVRLDARPDPVRSHNRGQGERDEFLLVAVSPGATPDQMTWYARDHVEEAGVQVVSLTTPTGHNTEIAVPLAYLDAAQGGPWKAFRLNIAVNDYDDPAGPLAQVWWRPRWGTMNDFAGSGTFVRR